MAKSINAKYLKYISEDEDQKEFFNILNSESDRGLVLVGSSHLDGVLMDILKLYLREPRVANDTLFSFQGALGSFSNRIEMAYRLGLICTNFAYVLDRIRKSRNQMAHHIENFALENSPHKDLIDDCIDVMVDSQFFSAIIQAYRDQTAEIRDAIIKSGLPAEHLMDKTKKERQDFLTVYFALVTTLKFIRHCLVIGIDKTEISVSLNTYLDDTTKLTELIENSLEI